MKNIKILFGIVFLIIFCISASAQIMTDGGFEDQSSSELGDPWWFDSDGDATIEVELGTGEAIEGSNNVKIVTTDLAAGEWIAIGQDLAVEPNTDYIITCYIKADQNIYWSGNPEWAKGYFGVTDDQDNSLADPTVAHYWDGQDGPGEPWAAGEIVFGGGFDMNVWRDYHYFFNSGDNTEVYLFIGTYVDNIVTWRVDGFSIAKVEDADILQDSGFEDQVSATLGDPWWIDTEDGTPPPGSTIEVEQGTGESFEGDNNVKFVTTAADQWIAIGQDLTVEENTDYYLVFHMKGDEIFWDGNPEWSKGYMKVIDESGTALADPTIPHYSDGGAIFEPWTPGEIVFGEEMMMRYWRDYIYPFNSGPNTEVYLMMGTYVNNVVTWRIDGFSAYKDVSSATGVGDEMDKLPTEYSLSQNYPNPFNPSTTISYSIPRVESQFQQHVTLKVYDLLGKEIRTLVNSTQGPGFYQVAFDARELTSGIYVYTLRTGDFVESKKMVLLK